MSRVICLLSLILTGSVVIGASPDAAPAQVTPLPTATPGPSPTPRPPELQIGISPYWMTADATLPSDMTVDIQLATQEDTDTLSVNASLNELNPALGINLTGWEPNLGFYMPRRAGILVTFKRGTEVVGNPYLLNITLDRDNVRGFLFTPQGQHPLSVVANPPSNTPWHSFNSQVNCFEYLVDDNHGDIGITKWETTIHVVNPPMPPRLIHSMKSVPGVDFQRHSWSRDEMLEIRGKTTVLSVISFAGTSEVAWRFTTTIPADCPLPPVHIYLPSAYQQRSKAVIPPPSPTVTATPPTR